MAPPARSRRLMSDAEPHEGAKAVEEEPPTDASRGVPLSSATSSSRRRVRDLSPYCGLQLL